VDGKGCGVKGFSGEVGQASFYMWNFQNKTYLLQAEEQFTARNYFDDAEKL